MDQQNQIFFFGRLGKKSDLKYTRHQEAVCYLAVAHHIEGKEKANWHKVVVWGKQAEICSVFLEKGSPLFVQGRMTEKEFKNEMGEIKNYKEICAEKIGFLSF